MLKVEGIDVYYGDLQALRGVSLEVDEGEIVALIGPNGAGKTTALKTIAGLLRPTRGSVTWAGHRLDKEAIHRIVETGISLVPEGRKVFASLSVLENLELGAFTAQARGDKDRTLREVYETFPLLETRKDQRAGTLSGGEQQMLAIGRALMSRPRLLMLDEPSLGLAPLVTKHIFEVIREVNGQGTAILLVEQNVRLALELADNAYVIESGRIVDRGPGKSLLGQERVRAAYLGI